LKKTIQATTGEGDFKARLKNVGINTVLRCTADNRIYGITFIDHQTRSVWNGSHLGKNLSAGVFNDWWNKGIKPEIDLQTPGSEKLATNTNQFITQNKISEDQSNTSFSNAANVISDIFGGLLPQTAGEDYEEDEFARQMKRRSRGRKR
jgi:hypothetical protein